MMNRQLPFASRTLTEHLLRGVLGFGSMWGAFLIAETHPLGAAGLAALMLLAFRGCPMCWAMGLLGTTRCVKC